VGPALPAGSQRDSVVALGRVYISCNPYGSSPRGSKVGEGPKLGVPAAFVVGTTARENGAGSDGVREQIIRIYEWKCSSMHLSQTSSLPKRFAFFPTKKESGVQLAAFCRKLKGLRVVCS